MELLETLSHMKFLYYIRNADISKVRYNSQAVISMIHQRAPATDDTEPTVRIIFFDHKKALILLTTTYFGKPSQPIYLLQHLFLDNRLPDR